MRMQLLPSPPPKLSVLSSCCELIFGSGGKVIYQFLGASGSSSLDALFSAELCSFSGTSRERCAFYSSEVGLYMMVVRNYDLLALMLVLMEQNVEARQHYLSLVSGRATGSEHTILNTAGSKVIKYSVIRHDEHAGIVFVRSSPVKNALSQKHGQRRRLWEGVDDAR